MIERAAESTMLSAGIGRSAGPRWFPPVSRACGYASVALAVLLFAAAIAVATGLLTQAGGPQIASPAPLAVFLATASLALGTFGWLFFRSARTLQRWQSLRVPVLGVGASGVHIGAHGWVPYAEIQRVRIDRAMRSVQLLTLSGPQETTVGAAVTDGELDEMLGVVAHELAAHRIPIDAVARP